MEREYYQYIVIKSPKNPLRKELERRIEEASKNPAAKKVMKGITSQPDIKTVEKV